MTDARGAFAAATAVAPSVDGPAAGRFTATVVEGWDIAGNANGGYLLAIAARGVTVATGMPDPVTLTAHYLAPGQVGPVTVDVEVVRRGRRHATATFGLASPDARHLVGVATATDLSTASGPSRVDATPPDLPAPDACVHLVPGDPVPPPFFGRVDVRLHPDDVPFRAGGHDVAVASDGARVRGWFRLRDDEPLDTLALVLAVDAFPPTSFTVDLPVAWTPTIELTAHVRHRPVPGWLACAFTTRNISGGYLETDGEIWDASGALVAQSRQLQLVPAGDDRRNPA